MSEREEGRDPADPAMPETPDPALLLSLIPDGLWIFDDDGVTSWANDRMAALLGREPAELVGMPATEVLDEQGREDFARHLAAMVRGGTPRDNVDAYFIRPDGTTVWGLISYVPVPESGGGRRGWLHRVTPYTERKELLDTLAAREQQLASAQAIAHIGSWSWDIASGVLEWSDEMCRILGVPPGTRGTPAAYEARVHPADRERLAAVLRSTLTDDVDYSADHRLVREDGTVRWVRARGLVERDAEGHAVRLSGTSQDITDLRQADAQAVRATRRLQALQGMTTAANRATTLAEALAEASRMLAASTSWTLLGAYVYDTGPGTTAGDLRLADTPVDLDPSIAERARASGEIEIGPEVPGHPGRRLVALPIQLRGETVCVVEASVDEERGLDPGTVRLLDQMGQQLVVVADRERSAAQLAEARDQAMEASRLKSEFLATMSHEIRTPMNGVIGLTDLLLRTDLDAHQRRLAESLQGAGLTLLGIINDILDLSKIEAGKLELEDVAFDVRDVLDRVASVLAGPARERGLELVVGCAADVPSRLRGDPVRFGQVVANLGSNAVKFTDVGEVVVRADVVSRDRTGVLLRVSVRDTGVGIAEGVRDRLFDAFTQADPSTTRRHGGTGLGLAISKQLVDALGGTLDLESTPGRGSTFSFTVPLGSVVDLTAAGTDGAAPDAGDTQGSDPAGSDAAGSADCAGAAGAERLAGKRVLVVDDKAESRAALTEQLHGWGMQVDAVSGTAEALATLVAGARSERAYDLVVVDRVAPGPDALDLARAIRDDGALRNVSTVLLTGEESADRAAAAAAGVHSVLSRPVRHAELRTMLSAAVGAPGPREQRSAGPRPGPGLGVAVLVVEDNPVNQLVARGFLEHLGCRVDVASDGVEAVDRLNSPHEYAAVLMDCRMPRLDGYDASRRVRAAEPPGRRVPIIAMTASVLEGERERCLEAGMDDFLTKPVVAAQLERVLRRWVGGIDGIDEAAGDDGGDDRLVDQGDDVLHAGRVAELEELVKDGVTFFERTATSFLGRVHEEVARIRAAVDRGDAPELVAAAHKLKGGALNLGLQRVGAAAAALEALGDTGTTEAALVHLERLDGEVARAVAVLRRATEQTG